MKNSTESVIAPKDQIHDLRATSSENKSATEPEQTKICNCCCRIRRSCSHHISSAECCCHNKSIQPQHRGCCGSRTHVAALAQPSQEEVPTPCQRNTQGGTPTACPALNNDTTASAGPEQQNSAASPTRNSPLTEQHFSGVESGLPSSSVNQQCSHVAVPGHQGSIVAYQPGSVELPRPARPSSQLEDLHGRNCTGSLGCQNCPKAATQCVGCCLRNSDVSCTIKVPSPKRYNGCCCCSNKLSAATLKLTNFSLADVEQRQHSVKGQGHIALSSMAAIPGSSAREHLPFLLSSCGSRPHGHGNMITNTFGRPLESTPPGALGIAAGSSTNSHFPEMPTFKTVSPYAFQKRYGLTTSGHPPASWVPPLQAPSIVPAWDHHTLANHLSQTLPIATTQLRRQCCQKQTMMSQIHRKQQEQHLQHQQHHEQYVPVSSGKPGQRLHAATAATQTENRHSATATQTPPLRGCKHVASSISPTLPQTSLVGFTDLSLPSLVFHPY